MSYENPPINGAESCPESKQVSSTTHPARPIPTGSSGGGPQGGLGGKS
jgi:hypothetical protein